MGDYVLLGMIARGGMAEIYKAKKKGVKGFEKMIAIKKILSGYGEDDKYIEMLVDEAKIAAELSHPNIVQIYDLGRKDNYYFIAMEYVLGKDLREIQTPAARTGQVVPRGDRHLADHQDTRGAELRPQGQGQPRPPLEIVHRDVSPPNILISYNGDVKLTDFGVSKASIKMHQTLSGALKGKLLYMSPEQACGESGIDYRSDLYSVGVVLFELLTGKKLFLDTSEMMVLKKVQNGEIIPPREINPDIDPTLEKIILTVAEQGVRQALPERRRHDRRPGGLHSQEVRPHPRARSTSPISCTTYSRGDIHREGIKVDLKPLPYTPKVARKSPRPSRPSEKPKPLPEIQVDAPAPHAVTAAACSPAGRRLEPPSASTSTTTRPRSRPKGRPCPKQEIFKPDSLFHELEKEKKQIPAAAAGRLCCWSAPSPPECISSCSTSPRPRPSIASPLPRPQAPPRPPACRRLPTPRPRR